MHALFVSGAPAHPDQAFEVRTGLRWVPTRHEKVPTNELEKLGCKEDIVSGITHQICLIGVVVGDICWLDQRISEGTALLKRVILWIIFHRICSCCIDPSIRLQRRLQIIIGVSSWLAPVTPVITRTIVRTLFQIAPCVVPIGIRVPRFVLMNYVRILVIVPCCLACIIPNEIAGYMRILF